MAKTYLRPLGLVYGADARGLVARHMAGALAGLGAIAFTHVEVIERDGSKISRRVEPFETWRDDERKNAICHPRADFAGLPMDATRIMGIVNVTPDSFSDGGENFDATIAIAHGRKIAEEGADVLDIGGESTRPGSDAVSIEVEMARIVPVIKALAKDHLVSADTRKSTVMSQALAAGARIVNDVSGLTYDTKSAGIVGRANAPVILMHAQGEPKTMQLAPKYHDVALDVYDALEKLIADAMAAGISKDNIAVDPGIGFGKTYAHNLELMRQLALFHGLGVPLLVGLSRKGLVGALTGEKKAGDRAAGSVGGALQAAMHGAQMLRVHDVKATADALKVFTACRDPDSVEL